MKLFCYSTSLYFRHRRVAIFPLLAWREKFGRKHVLRVPIHVVVVDSTEARPQLRSERDTSALFASRAAYATYTTRAAPTTPTLHAVRALSWLARSPRSYSSVTVATSGNFSILLMFSPFSQRQYSPSLHMHTVSNNFIFFFILLSNFDINIYIYNNLWVYLFPNWISYFI